MSVNAVTVDENGISIKSFNEIRQALGSDYQSVFPNLVTDPSTPDGMLIDIVAYTIMELAQSIQAIYSNMNLATASGSFLSNIAFLAGLPRLDGEDDESLRIRIGTASHSGLATVDNMVTFLRSANLNVTVSENTSDKEKNGLPPHSVCVFVPEDYEAPESWTGSKENYVAQKIWMCKPAGIRTSGNMNGQATDESGYLQDVFFSVIESTLFSLKVVLKKYSEESLPDDFESRIKECIVRWANEKITPGKDIIPQRFCAPIYDNVDGIENVEVYSREGSSGNWSSEVVRISADTLAKFSEDDIIVEVEGENVS